MTIAETLQLQLGTNVSVAVSGQFRVGDIRHNVAELTAVSRTLGFAPTVAFADGVARFVEWVLSEAVQADRYDESLAELRDKGLFK